MSSNSGNDANANKARGIGLRDRLILTVLIVAALTTIPSIYALSRLRALKRIASTATLHGRAYAALGSFGARLGDVNRFEGAYIVTGDPAPRMARDSALKEAHASLDSLESANYSKEVAPARAHLDRI